MISNLYSAVVVIRSFALLSAEVQPPELATDSAAVKPSPPNSSHPPCRDTLPRTPSHSSPDASNHSAAVTSSLFRRPPSTPHDSEPLEVKYVEIPSEPTLEGEDVIVVEQVPEATPELVVETATLRSSKLKKVIRWPKLEEGLQKTRNTLWAWRVSF
ncbi:hypothetical protein SEVIR_9G364701v4 [Setaria viridis]|nr:uncharacterized protein LOC117837176 isoform X1 [Setaria viridis]